MDLDTLVRFKIAHRPGQLARLCAAVGEQGGLIGDILTISLGKQETVRDIVIETRDEAHLALVLDRVRDVAGVEVISTKDVVFERHRGGKVHCGSRVRIETHEDLRTIYTPGVARVCLAIKADPSIAPTYTSIANTVAICTNGTRVLGLGNIGALASLPVMEGKAAIYDRFAGVSAVPILIDTEDPEEFIRTVVRIAPGFGGIHLEDIRIPDCFEIEARLDEALAIPVMHDDQHGTATVAVAAVESACRLAGQALEEARVGVIGLGAAGSAIAQLTIARGVKEVHVADVTEAAVARLVGMGGVASTLAGVLERCDIVIAATGRPGLIAPASVREGQVILALSNPVPEITPEEALAAGAAVASDGRVVNNALAYPGLFKAALRCGAPRISAGMKLAAARVLSGLAEPGELVPSPLDLDVHRAVCRATQEAAIAEGLANVAEPVDA